MIKSKEPPCRDTRPCFGATIYRGGYRHCTVLTEGYQADGDCPFCKPVADITDGKRYPIDTRYGSGRSK